MKLPHLRKHKDYIRSIEINMGPKDYNAYRMNGCGANDSNVCHIYVCVCVWFFV